MVEPATCFLLGGTDRVIVVAGRDYHFEDHPQLGPCPMTNKGEARELRPQHRFWHAVTCWYEQGRQFGADGRCIWAEPPDPMAGMVHLGGRHWAFPETAEHFLGSRAKQP